MIVKAIDHTGIALDEWLAPPRKPGPAPRPAPSGPLSGERIAILGEPRDGALACRIAALGGRIVSAVGNTTTALVIAGRAPFAYSIRNSGAYRRAEQYRRLGGKIRIVSEQDLALPEVAPTAAE